MLRALVAVALGLAACTEGPAGLGAGDDAAPMVDAATGGQDGSALPLDGGAGFAHLVFTVDDGDTKLPIPARVIFRPVPGAGFADSITSGTPDPNSPGSQTGAIVAPGVLGSPEGVMLMNGQGTVPVPPGQYTLFITRGPEYEAVQTTVNVGLGDVVPVTATLDRTVDTTGWLAADLHVHVARSYDSKLPAERRVISMVSNGVEVIVSTDHNVATDLAPVVNALGYGGELVGTVIGDEFNFTMGHGGAYPVPYDPTKPGGGAPPYQTYVDVPNRICGQPMIGINCFGANDAFDMMHQQVPGTTVVTVNHPYYPGNDLGYFTNIGWGAGTPNPPPAMLPSAGKFDALEILNGYQTSDPSENALTTDWFALLQQGYKVTALGSSDTHKINWVRSGWPRSWLKLPSDRPGDVTGQTLADTIRHQRVIASTGPFVTLNVDGADIGDQIIPKTAGQATVKVTVDAPPWIEVDTVKVYVNGQVAQTFAVGTGKRPLLTTSFTQTISADSWIVAFASGTQPLAPDVVGEYSHVNGYEMTPWAITNPIFVDADGDGAWTPPPGPAGFPRPMHPVPFRGQVPQSCDGSEIVGGEPPLEAPEHVLMPLLY